MTSGIVTIYEFVHIDRSSHVSALHPGRRYYRGDSVVLPRPQVTDVVWRVLEEEAERAKYGDK